MADSEHLHSWHEGKTKQTLVTFVEQVTNPSSNDFVLPAQRIAVFDNDGTLWIEQPRYTQLSFTLDRIKALAADHPEWQKNPVFKAVLDNDLHTVMAADEKGLLELVAATHANMTPQQFETIVQDWLNTAEHPRFQRKYTELVYQPIIELVNYLHANDFSTYIVSGGGIEFMRPWTKLAYGIPPSNVIGSSIKTQFEIIDGVPTIMRLPEVSFNDDGPGKPVAINLHIGQRPLAAFGNSDGDLQMLQWTMAGDGARLGVLVHHTDAEREYAYDRQSSFGRLDKALDAAVENNWLVIDMQKDWKTVFPTTK